jgi:hypothetical protein
MVKDENIPKECTALHKAYKGDLDVKYSYGERFVRLTWHRDL